MAHESVELIASVLLEGGAPPPLKLFHFYNNMAGDGGATALSTIVSSCPHVIDFRFSATRAGMTGCLAIASSLSTLTELVHLDLNDCNFSKQAGTSLCESLSKMVFLKSTILIFIMYILRTSFFYFSTSWKFYS